ncbi:hypothetical protein FPZ24_09980 [Sphingomonas panacisoli]|uniref:Uncharacterized protein n=1 Tax=Sphingomonas panacisoli TaxID=1813879 RepID=A0A5B8LI30_9SPHN|nr:hypothetical protein [Sphingomonas panacisoli]QDZ07773.1 hypothetical protein FPZ24_09980 [Sphingomonas panacisoli]
MPATSTCLNSRCRTSVEGTMAKCPNCGGGMRTPRRVRIAGGFLLACGAFLAGMMGWLYYALSPTMLHPGTRIGGTTFNGTAEQARTILMLFATIAAFGAGSMFYGLWMLFTGRRSIALMLVVLALAVAIGGMCWWTMQVVPET